MTFGDGRSDRLLTVGRAAHNDDQCGKRTKKVLGSPTTSLVHAANRSPPLFLTDGLGSVRAITDCSGNVTKTFQTDEFGITLLTQGTSPEPFRFTGQEWGAESGFYNLRARFYAPALGRFVSRDAFAGSTASPLSLNRTSYAGNNPVNVVDPSGFVNAVNRDSYDSGSTDNLCFSTAGGIFGGYLVNMACLNLPFGSTQDALIWTPFGPQVISFTAFAQDPPGGGSSDPTEGQIRHFERQLVESGRESLLRSQVTLLQRLTEHVAKLERIEQTGGYRSFVEREIRNFSQQLAAIEQVLGGMP